MRNIMLIAKKEIHAYFNSPFAYIVLTAFLAIAGWFFSVTLFLNNQASLRTLFSTISVAYIIFIPAITMSLISKEKNLRTLELLTTLPIQDHQIVIGKFISAMTLISTGLLFTAVNFFTIVWLGQNIDFGQIIGGYFGLLLVGGVYTAIGLFASGLSKNQIICFLIAAIIIGFFFLLDSLLIFIPASLNSFFQYISINYHFNNIEHGVIDTRTLAYFISLIAIFLYSSVTVIKARKW